MRLLKQGGRTGSRKLRKGDEINALYESHLDLKAMDEILKEIHEIGADAVRQKHGLQKQKG